MTSATLTTMQLVILSALLFLGSSVVFEGSEGVEVSLEEQVPLNVSTKPSLQPKETPPVTGNFVLKNLLRQVCVRTSVGVVFTVMDKKKKSFFNLDPKSTAATGYCGDQKAVLSLVFDGGNLEFTFLKDGGLVYVSTLRAKLQPAPPCKNCKSHTYTGIMDHEKLFSAKTGQSFKCKSDTSLILSDNLRIKLVSLQVQAFDLFGGAFGKEVDCWADYINQIVPIALGGVVVGVILIAVLIYVLVREHRGQGYEQL